MQSRYVLPSWYGVGAALEEYLAEDGERLAQLQHMYRSWPFLRAFLDNLQMTLSKADMHIAHHYSLLVDDEALRQRLSTNIAEEYQRTRRMLLQIVGGKALLDTTPVLQRSIRLRNPYVDPLSYFQVALLRRLRAIGGPRRQRRHDPCAQAWLGAYDGPPHHSRPMSNLGVGQLDRAWVERG